MRIKSDFRSPRVYIVLIIDLSWTWKKCWFFTPKQRDSSFQPHSGQFWQSKKKRTTVEGGESGKIFTMAETCGRSLGAFRRSLRSETIWITKWLLFCVQRATSLPMTYAWGLPSQAHCSVSVVFCTCSIHQLSDPWPVLCVSDLTIPVPR